MTRTRTNGTNPVLPAPVVGWIMKHARKNYWRVAGWYELDDMIQDGILCGYKCLAKYGSPVPKTGIDRPRLNEITEPHFMSLVQSAFFNHIGQLIRNKRRGDDITTKFSDMDSEKSEANALERVVPAHEADQDFRAWLTELPEHIRATITAGLDFEVELRAFVWESENI